MTEENLWLRQLAENPEHSQWYIKRFRDLAARGADLHGEARMIDAMASRGARILDAGCGTGRVGGHLAESGHTVTGVDLDPALIEDARTSYPRSQWLVGDLTALELPDRFDLIVCAGNVLTFVAPSTRVEILRRLAGHLAPDGRLITGFGAGRGYDFDAYLADVKEAGLAQSLLLGTWDLRPFGPDSDFLVAVLTR
jgi:2-polyprenyl-3-methyl-5-hydroxy-6-metoxy-1,4-benzoquinol methylase